jgi:hypothetical protein
MDTYVCGTILWRADDDAGTMHSEHLHEKAISGLVTVSASFHFALKRRSSDESELST